MLLIPVHLWLQDKEPKGIIPLENIHLREVQDRNKPHCFELYATNNEVIKACKTDSEGKVVEGMWQLHMVIGMLPSVHVFDVRMNAS